MYTQTTSRFGNLTMKYPDFKSGEADAEAAQPEQVGRWKRILKLVVIDAVKNKNLKLFVYIS